MRRTQGGVFRTVLRTRSGRRQGGPRFASTRWEPERQHPAARCWDEVWAEGSLRPALDGRRYYCGIYSRAAVGSGVGIAFARLPDRPWQKMSCPWHRCPARRPDEGDDARWGSCGQGPARVIMFTRRESGDSRKGAMGCSPQSRGRSAQSPSRAITSVPGGARPTEGVAFPRSPQKTDCNRIAQCQD
jgi:hypothetical protein